MYKSSVFFILIIWFFSLEITYSQISYGGRPKAAMRTTKSYRLPINSLDLPKVNNDSLQKVNSNDYTNEKVLTFAHNFEVDIDITKYGTIDSLNDGILTRYVVISEGAVSLNFGFSSYNLPKGAQLFLYDPSRKNMIGGFTHKNNKSNGELATTIIHNDTICIELFEPYNASYKAELILSRVSHGFMDLRKSLKDLEGFGASGSCNMNINCDDGKSWGKEKRSVAMIMSGGSRLCTGTMINNVRQDFTPYMLTAEHCFRTGYESWVFVFNYESPDCSDIEGQLDQSISGAELKSRNNYTDFMLLELSERPPKAYNVYYSGWDRTGDIPDSTVCIHHPHGDIKKISFDDDKPVISSLYDGDPLVEWQILQWDRNTTTEVSSSGSGLWDNNHRLIGQLHGGDAVCGNNVNDFYGMLSFSWDGINSASRLKDYLDPDNTNSDVLDGIGTVGFYTDFKEYFKDSIVQFYSFAETDSAEYYWSFGDGNTSTLANPVHSYSSSGKYTVSLIVKEDGEIDTITIEDYIEIFDYYDIKCYDSPNYVEASTVYFPENDINYGFISGNNAFGDKAKAEKFNINDYNFPGDKYIKEVKMYFYYSTGLGRIKVKVWDNTGDFNTPGNVLAEKSYKVNEIPAGDPEQCLLVRFDYPVLVSTDFFVGIELDYSTDAGQVALYTTNINDKEYYSGYELTIKDVWQVYGVPVDNGGSGKNIANAIVPKVCPDNLTTNISTNEDAFEVNIFPNPCTEYLHMDVNITSDNVNSVSLEIVDILGKIVASYSSSNISNISPINTSNYMEGIYYLKIKINDEMVIKPFFKYR